MKIHHKLPEDGCWKARYEAEFYRLLPKKRNLYEDNREFKHGLRYLIWSAYARRWYERYLDSQTTTEEDIAYWVERGMLWLYPDEEHKQEIREDVEKNKVPYWVLMKRRQGEMNWERHNSTRNDGNGWQLRMKLYKEQKQIGRK